MIYVTSEYINMLTCQFLMFRIHSIYGCSLDQFKIEVLQGATEESVFKMVSHQERGEMVSL